MMKLGEKVVILRAADCVNGIPNTFKFMKDSIVEWSQSQPGQTVTAKVPKGVGFIDGQGGVKKAANGGAVVQDNDVWTFA